MIALYSHLLPLARQDGLLENAMRISAGYAPGITPSFVAYPGTAFSSLHHFVVFMEGSTPLTERLLRPVLIDATRGTFTDSRQLPCYITALHLSQPLYFGDYGGLPLKIIWALFDMAIIVVLLSGLYLWWARNQAIRQQAIREKQLHHRSRKARSDEQILSLYTNEKTS